MAANTSPIFALSPNLTEITFVNADSTTPKTIFTAATDGSVLKHINVTSDDTTDPVLLDVFVDDGTTAYLLGRVGVATLAGTDGTEPAVDILDAGMIPGLGTNGSLFLASGYTVEVAPSVAITAAKTVTLVGIGVDY